MGYDPVMGFRRDGDDVWYPHWQIVVHTGAVQEPYESYGAASGDVDLKERAIALSIENPDTVVSVQASARMRLQVKNGEIICDRKFSEFYIVESDVDRESESIFDGLTLCDHDGMGAYDYRK